MKRGVSRREVLIWETGRTPTFTDEIPTGESMSESEDTGGGEGRKIPIRQTR